MEEKIKAIIESYDCLTQYPHGKEHAINTEQYDDLAKEIYQLVTVESLSKTIRAKSVSDATPNRIQISEKMAEECVSKIVLSEWVDIKNRHMVELTIRNSMSEYHSLISQNNPTGLHSEGWISVKTRLPAKGQDVLWGEIGNDKIYRERYLIDMLEPYYVTEYTHWQPLPPPPDKKEKEKYRFMCSECGTGYNTSHICKPEAS